MRLTIFWRVLLAQISLITLILGVSLYAHAQLDRLTRLSTEILARDAASIEEEKRLRTIFLGQMRSAEKYLLYHSTLKRPCGQLIVVDDGYDLFLTMMLYPNFGWDVPAYHLEGDPEGRSFAEILVDVVATEVIEPWGGGKWHLEIFRSVAPEPENWNGEM